MRALTGSVFVADVPPLGVFFLSVRSFNLPNFKVDGNAPRGDTVFKSELSANQQPPSLTCADLLD